MCVQYIVIKNIYRHTTEEKEDVHRLCNESRGFSTKDSPDILETKDQLKL